MPYSRKTSLPAYKENPDLKESQKKQVLQLMKRLGGVACLKQLQQEMKIPQSSISGRIGDLRQEGKVYDTNELVIFDGRKRKLFGVAKKPRTIKPGNKKKKSTSKSPKKVNGDLFSMLPQPKKA